MKLTGKLSTLGFRVQLATLLNWILDFLTNRPQTVWIGGHTSSTLVLNTNTKSCVLSSPPADAVHPWLQWWSMLRSLWTNPPSSAGLQTRRRIDIRNKSATLQSCAQRPTYCSMSIKPRSWSLILEKKEEKTPPHVYQWSWVELSGAGEQFQVPGNQHHRETVTMSHISTLIKKAQKQLHFLGKLKETKNEEKNIILVIF